MTAPKLPGVFAKLAPLLNHYGYLALVVFVLAENFGVPLPGETILVAAAVYAGAGQLNIVLVGVFGFVAAVVGDNLGFAIGHFGGRRLVVRYGRYVFLTEERVAKAESFFQRYGGRVVAGARFVEGLRQANGIIAGISGMHWFTFFCFNALGAALWVSVWTTVGYFAGSHIEAVYGAITHYFIIAIAVLVVLGIAEYLRRRHKKRHSVDPAAGQVSAPPADR